MRLQRCEYPKDLGVEASRIRERENRSVSKVASIVDKFSIEISRIAWRLAVEDFLVPKGPDERSER